MDVDTLRDWSMSTSTNSFKATSVYSNISSTIYAKYIWILANNLAWADQVKISNTNRPALFYMILKVGETDIVKETTAIETTLELL